MTDFGQIKKLYNIRESNGFCESEILSVKNVFGSLPQVLIDYYIELGKYEFNQTQDSLLSPAELQHFQYSDYLVFYCENQRCCLWGIHKDDLSQPNPPVYMSENENEWILECETLTEFLFAMACLQATFTLPYSPNIFRELEKNDFLFIQNNFKNKHVRFREWTCGIEFYGNYDDSVIILMGGCEQMAYASNSKEHFEEMDNVLSKLGTEL